MDLSIETFEKKHDHLLCIDSDGTVIDAMNVKHNRCHGLSFIEEWGAYGLLDFLSVMTSQEIGTKDECVARMIEKGYKPENILMIGDAWPDVNAARANGVWYYPILTRREGESWTEFTQTYFDRFLQDRYGDCQQELMDRFEQNFTQQGE